MGTPKRKYRSQKVLVSPKIAEKIRLLEAGKEMGQKLKVDMFPNVLEGVKDILLPLVPWLDKPIFPGAAFADYPTPKTFERKRGVHLFNSGIMDIWLERSGKWFLRFRELYRSDATFQEVNSQQLAEIMLQKSDDFLKVFLRGGNIIEEIPFIKDITLYNAMSLQFLSQCFENVKDLVKEREKRLRIMNEWLNLLHEFSQSLDPLISQSREVSIKGYSIFEDRAHGTSRCTSDYFCPEALEPFWKMLKNRDPVSEYKEFITEHNFGSLEDFLQRLIWILDDIKKDSGDADANLLFGLSSNRFPLTEGEITVLKKLVNSI